MSENINTNAFLMLFLLWCNISYWLQIIYLYLNYIFCQLINAYFFSKINIILKTDFIYISHNVILINIQKYFANKSKFSLPVRLDVQKYI